MAVPASTEHPRGIPTAVHVLCRREDGLVLMLRRAGTGFFDGLYSLPGGHVEPGESIRAAAVREMAEETGLRLEEESLAWMGVVHRLSDTNRIDFFLRAHRWQGEPCLMEPHKCDLLDWLDPESFADQTVPFVREAMCRCEEPWVLELDF